MATSTYWELCPVSRRVGMLLRNLSAWEVRIPPKTVIGNVQMAEMVPNKKSLNPTSKVLPLKEQKEPSQVSWPTCSNSPKKELTQPTPISLQLELGDPTSECDVLNQVDLLGCMKWDPEDQQEVRKIPREYADVFAKDNPRSGMNLSGKTQDYPERRG